MDSEYIKWKITTMEKYNKNQNSDIQEIFNLKLDMYNSSLDFDIDFNREDILTFLSNRHKTEKEKLTQAFVEETNFLNSFADQTKFKSQLTIKIDNVFKGWLEGKKTEYDTFVNARKIKDDNTTNTVYEKKLKKYEKIMEDFSNYSD